MTSDDDMRFSGPRLKIDRAKHHISDLNSQIAAFLESNPHVFVVQNSSSNIGAYTVTHEVPMAQIPNLWSAITGDAVHNLRCALDHLACDLVRMNNGDPDDVYFPFCRDGNYLDAMIKKRHIDRAGRDVVEKIKSCKPYDGGNQDLWDLHQLDIMDKHQGIIPVYKLANRINTPEIKAEWQGVTSIGLTVLAGKRLNVGEKIKVPVEIVLGKGPFQGKSLLPVLRQLAQLVEGVIYRFDT